MKKLLIKMGLLYEKEPEAPKRDEELIKNPGRRFTDPVRAAAIINDESTQETGARLFDKRSINLDTGEGNHKLEINLNEYLKDVPRYPPYETAFPAVSPQQILEVNSDLINKIAATFTHDDKMFLKYIFPVMHNLAAVIHLLPASRAHHHALPGGAFRHALEVADLAATGALGILRDKRIRNSDTEAYQLRMQIACIIAGLLHDAGKPVSDIAVTDHRSDEEWNPHTSSLYKWLMKRDADKYYITWRKGRHQQHEMFSGRIYDKVVPAHINEFISHFGPQIQSWIFESLSHNEVNKDSNPIYKVVRLADQVSVRDDTKVMNARGQTGSASLPVEQHILDCMRRMLHTDRWPTNEKGSPLWVDLDGNVYLLWAKAANDVIAALDDMEMPGILRDKDSIAESLLASGMLEENPYADACGCHQMYWYIQPSELASGTSKRPTINLAVKIADPKSLFTAKRPSSGTYIKILEEDPFADGATTKEAIKANTLQPKSKVAAEEEKATKNRKVPNKKQSVPVINNDAAEVSLDSLTGERSDALFAGIYSEAEEVYPVEMSGDTILDAGVDEDRSSTDATAADNAQVLLDAENEEKRIKAGEILSFDVLKKAKVFEGTPFNGNLSLTWPVEGVDEDLMMDILDSLVEENLLAVDPNNPHKQIFNHKDQNYLVLDVYGDNMVGKKLKIKPTEPISSVDVPIVAEPVEKFKVAVKKDVGSSVLKAFTKTSELNNSANNDAEKATIRAGNAKEANQKIETSLESSSAHAEKNVLEEENQNSDSNSLKPDIDVDPIALHLSDDLRREIRQIPALRQFSAEQEVMVRALSTVIRAGKKVPINNKKAGIFFCTEEEIRSALNQAGLDSRYAYVIQKLRISATLKSKLVSKIGYGFNFVYKEDA